MKSKEHKRMREEARELYYNTGQSIQELAPRYGKSERTIYRWLKYPPEKNSLVSHQPKKKNVRPRQYPLKIFTRIKELKKELPQRSAPIIHTLLQKEFPTNCPSISTIRKYIRDKGLIPEKRERRLGYIKFERKQPNDLWQIDIAGVQTIGHLGQLYLIAILDDCSRYIVAAKYFRHQKGINVIKVIRDAIMIYGRPNQILADNGTQFRNLIGELGTKYSRLLEHLGVKPIFARPHHPQTKGKLERWFGTVKQMFLPEARFYVKNHPKCFLHEFNEKLKEWIEWYNTKKPHRSLPNKIAPKSVFFRPNDRIFRPLQIKMNWNRWLSEATHRKVNKYNEISYKSQKFMVPSGYSGSPIDVIEYEDKIELYFKDKLLIVHPYNVPPNLERKKRKISKVGIIMYKGKHYYIDYKFAGKTVEVLEINQGKHLLVYLHGTLVKTLNL